MCQDLRWSQVLIPAAPLPIQLPACGLGKQSRTAQSLGTLHPDELIGYASDRYDFLTQDDHAIVVNDEYQFTMKGNFHFIGDHYELLDELGNTIAKISFNYFNTKGDLYDMSGNLIASYRSNYFRKDYVVIIYDNDLFDDNALLMMFASYYSDRAADSD